MSLNLVINTNHCCQCHHCIILCVLHYEFIAHHTSQ